MPTEPIGAPREKAIGFAQGIENCADLKLAFEGVWDAQRSPDQRIASSRRVNHPK